MITYDMTRITAIILSSLLAVTSARADILDNAACAIAAASPEVANSTLGGQSEVEGILADNRLPDPAVELEHLWGNKGAGNKLTVNVSQEFEFPTVYSRRRTAASTTSRALEFLQRSTFMDKALEVKELLIEYIHTRNCLSIYGRILDNIDSLASATDRAISGGELMRLDASKLRIERIGVEGQIAILDGRLAEITSTLSGIAGGADVTEVLSTLPGDIPFEQLLTKDHYQRQAIEADPRIDYNSTMAEAALARSRVIDASRLPSFSLGYIFNREGGADFQGLSAGISLPIYSMEHQRKAVAMERENLLAQNDMLTISSQTMVAGTYARAERQRDLVMKYRTVLADASYPDLLDRAYASRTITLLTYLQETRYFTEAHIALFDAERDYALSLARLNRYTLLPHEL